MRFLLGFLSALLLGLLVITAFGIRSLRSPAQTEPSRMETSFVNQGKLWLIPADDEAGSEMPEKNEENILDGGEHYNHHCAVCHDLEGDADSKFARSFYPPVADLTSSRVQAYSDDQLKHIIDDGIRYTGMPGWEKDVDDDDQWKMVYYLRTLANPQQREKYEEMLREKGKWKVGLPTAKHEHREHETVEMSPEGQAPEGQAPEGQSMLGPAAEEHEHNQAGMQQESEQQESEGQSTDTPQPKSPQ